MTNRPRARRAETVVYTLGVVTLSTPAYVILGMLRLGEQSGYDIKRRVEVSTRYFSTISQAQIYPLLKSLERAALVKGRSNPQGKRRRRVYVLTQGGEAVLAAWLRADDELPLEVRDVGLLKLFFSDALDPGEARQLVGALRARSERILGQLQRESGPAARRVREDGNRLPLLTLEFGLAMHEAWIECCARLERELARPDEIAHAREGRKSPVRCRAEG